MYTINVHNYSANEIMLGHRDAENMVSMVLVAREPCQSNDLKAIGCE